MNRMLLIAHKDLKNREKMESTGRSDEKGYGGTRRESENEQSEERTTGEEKLTTEKRKSTE